MILKNLEIMVVEDDELQRLALTQNLKDLGSICEAESKKEALKILDDRMKLDLVFLDLDLLDGDLLGLELIKPALATGAYVVVLSGRQEDEFIITAYENGCHDYLSKPFNKKSLELVLNKYSMVKSKGELRDFLARDYITRDPKLIKSLEIINEIKLSQEPVLLSGPTGTGKSYLAKLIHQILFKTEENFMEINCSEIPENLLESELFGYEKGAFSGAESSKKGKLLLADGGTLFLDEVATMPELLQQKLLKAIEEKKFFPLGSEKPVSSNFRLISATCEDLGQLVRDKKFREDLYFRIEGFKIHLKPLAERSSDIELLLKHFSKQTQRRIVFTSEAKESLNKYFWPGNIRELQKLVNKLSIKSKGIIEESDLPENIRLNSHPCYIENKNSTAETPTEMNGDVFGLSENQLAFVEKNGLRTFLQNIENKTVNHFYRRNNEKVRQTLGQLKISNSSFYKILNRIKAQLA
jgi:DNA-binding NtrC family response regulator